MQPLGCQFIYCVNKKDANYAKGKAAFPCNIQQNMIHYHHKNCHFCEHTKFQGKPLMTELYFLPAAGGGISYGYGMVLPVALSIILL